MKYFLDTEFIENGRREPLQLLSLGIVAENGSEIYFENSEADFTKANDWVKKNVFPWLERIGPVLRTPAEMAEEIKKFIPPKPGYDKNGGLPSGLWDAPEFWAYFADYDWVLFCQLFGTMMDLPEGYPMYCMDLMQYAKHIGIPRRAFPEQDQVEHNALNDARWNKKVFEFLEQQRKLR